ncbi:M23 family metallopeptidase [Aquamicrobium sp. LC103]|uniref:M23 family metallopeptidase n=1 Tax=Aquamicrobium sp. LC103 TaxID=1120658 RepID=UPI000AFDEF81|nr:M23 family metallopeptidase [Aquamicrobium sp. LC103]
MELGRRLTTDFQEGRYEVIWERMTEEMRAALGSSGTLAELAKAMESQFGAEKATIFEEAEPHLGYRIYQRIAEHEKGPLPVLTQWTLDGDDRVAGFFVRPRQPPAASDFLDYETKATLRLPFEGEWHVYWGGRTPEDNYHAVDPGQRFASDFLVVTDGSSSRGEGTRLEEYHCWDRRILAPASGTVAAAVDDLPDNPLGEMDPRNPAGNHVVLDLGNDEYAFLAHLKEGSVGVEKGDSVQAGQEIGRCGNSGNSSEPHLHFHLQTTPSLGAGEGLPAFFRDYVADGERVEKGEPQRGQTVAPEAD